MKQKRKADSPAAGDPPPRTVLVIESDPDMRVAVAQLLAEWGLNVLEVGAEGQMPAAGAHPDVAAIIADFELSGTAHWPPLLTGLDLALAVARRSERDIPTLVVSSDYGRKAIPACSPHRFVVLFKPLLPGLLHRWLVGAGLLAAEPLAA